MTRWPEHLRCYLPDGQGIPDPPPTPPGFDPTWWSGFRDRLDGLVQRVDRGGAHHQRVRFALLAARANAVADDVALERVVRLASEPLDLDAVEVQPSRCRTSRSRVLPEGWPPAYPMALTASAKARMRGRNAARAASTRRKPLPAYRGGTGRYIVRCREGERPVVLTADGRLAENVRIDTRTFLVVPTGRNAIAASADRERPVPRDNRVERALDAIIALAAGNLEAPPAPNITVNVPEQPPPVVHVHVLEQKQRATVATPIRDEETGEIIRVEHRPVDE